jgi:hypothetical protein
MVLVFVVLVVTAQSQQLRAVLAYLRLPDMDDPEPEDTSACTDIINHVINICGFYTDSLMVWYIHQLQWSELAYVVMHGLEDAKEFEVFQMMESQLLESRC